MQVEDVPRVVEIAGALKDAPNWQPQAYLGYVNQEAFPPSLAFVAEDAVAGVVGFILTALFPPQAELQSIAVAAAAQRRGIARRLFAAVIAAMKERAITEVWLEVRESNCAARAMYSSLGFVETGRRRAYYSDPKEDAILMSRSGFRATGNWRRYSQ